MKKEEKKVAKTTPAPKKAVAKKEPETPEVKLPEVTTKEHPGHGTSYYANGVRVFNIKTRRGGNAIAFFTKKSEVTGLEETKDTRYACQYSGPMQEVLNKAYTVCKLGEAPVIEVKKEAVKEGE